MPRLWTGLLTTPQPGMFVQPDNKGFSTGVMVMRILRLMPRIGPTSAPYTQFTVVFLLSNPLCVRNSVLQTQPCR